MSDVKTREQEWGELLENLFHTKVAATNRHSQFSDRRRTVLYTLEVLNLAESSHKLVTPIFKGELERVDYDKIRLLMQELLRPPQAMSFEDVRKVVLHGPRRFHTVLADIKFEEFLQEHGIEYSPDDLDIPLNLDQYRYSSAQEGQTNQNSLIYSLTQRDLLPQLVEDKAKLHGMTRPRYIQKAMEDIPKILLQPEFDSDWEAFEPVMDEFPEWVQGEARRLYDTEVSANKLLRFWMLLWFVTGVVWAVFQGLPQDIKNTMLLSMVAMLVPIGRVLYKKLDREVYWVEKIWKKRIQKEED